MTNLKNELPVAVHVHSGGDARVRIGGAGIPLHEVSTASFQVTGATRYRLTLHARSTPGLVLLVGYSAPVTPANASLLCPDMSSILDDVPEGTTVHVMVLNPMDSSPMPGGENDHAVVSLYA